MFILFFLLSSFFFLLCRVPSDAAMRAVADFSRKTGDFAALSLTDLRVLALTYQLELEQNGTQFVRLEPARSLKMAAARAAAAKLISPADQAKSSSSSVTNNVTTPVTAEKETVTTVTPSQGNELVESVNVEDSAALGGDVDDNENEEFDEIIELEHLEGDDRNGDDSEEDDEEDDDEEDDDDEEEEEGKSEEPSQANPPIVTPKISWGTPAGPGPDSTKAWASSGSDATDANAALAELQLADEEQFPSLGMSMSTSKGRGGTSGSESSEPDMCSSMVADINNNNEKTSMWADLGTWVEAEGGEGILPSAHKQPSSLSSSSVVSSSNNGAALPKWSQVALASVSASEQIASAHGHTTTNASYNR